MDEEEEGEQEEDEEEEEEEKEEEEQEENEKEKKDEVNEEEGNEEVEEEEEGEVRRFNVGRGLVVHDLPAAAYCSGGRPASTARAIAAALLSSTFLPSAPKCRLPSSRGLHSFRFQLNLSSSVHRVTQLNS